MLKEAHGRCEAEYEHSQGSLFNYRSAESIQEVFWFQRGFQPWTIEYCIDSAKHQTQRRLQAAIELILDNVPAISICNIPSTFSLETRSQMLSDGSMSERP